MKKIFYLIIIIAVAVGACNTNKTYTDTDSMIADVKATVDEISVEDLKVKIDSMEMFYLIDVRDKVEHNPGYIPGSINISRGTLEFKVSNEAFWEAEFLYPPEKSDLIVIYCKKGKRGILATSALKKLGYTNVMNLEGGWKKWELTYPLMYEKNLDDMSHEVHADEGGC